MRRCDCPARFPAAVVHRYVQTSVEHFAFPCVVITTKNHRNKGDRLTCNLRRNVFVKIRTLVFGVGICLMIMMFGCLTESASAQVNDPIASKANHAKAEALIPQLEAAITERDDRTARELFDELKKLIPTDPRITFLRSRMAALPQPMIVDLGGGVTMEFMLIQPGSFIMGSEMSPNAKPPHKVTINQPFYMGRYEVTLAQWEKVMGKTWTWQGEKARNPNNPVEQVSWSDCRGFITNLNKKVLGLRCGLPTEAQWEYACRAGSSGDYFFGKGNLDKKGSLDKYAWYDLIDGAHPVGQKKPNPWGLYDMYGNVWEWCQDTYHDTYNGSPADGSAWMEGGEGWVLRGGSWASSSRLATSYSRCNGGGYRGNQFVGGKNNGNIDNYGFRCVVLSRDSSGLLEAQQVWSNKLIAVNQELLNRSAVTQFEAAKAKAVEAQAKATAGQTASAINLFKEAVTALREAEVVVKSLVEAQQAWSNKLIAVNQELLNRSAVTQFQAAQAKAVEAQAKSVAGQTASAASLFKEAVNTLTEAENFVEAQQFWFNRLTLANQELLNRYAVNQFQAARTKVVEAQAKATAGQTASAINLFKEAVTALTEAEAVVKSLVEVQQAWSNNLTAANQELLNRYAAAQFHAAKAKAVEAQAKTAAGQTARAVSLFKEAVTALTESEAVAGVGELKQRSRSDSNLKDIRQNNNSSTAETTWKLDLGDGVIMEFILIPPGSFVMGSEKTDNAKPVHKVTISQPFYMGKYEVTQEQWEKVMGDNTPRYRYRNPNGKCPIQPVSWLECQTFVAKLTEKTPRLKFSLPSEAQWEYACRAGSTNDYCYGQWDDKLKEYAWYNNNSGPHPVGEKKPNAWGLYDMHGNVSEWCQDVFRDTYRSAPMDGSVWTDPTQHPVGGRDRRVVRGGNCYSDPRELRAWSRHESAPEEIWPLSGFRCVMQLSGAPGQ